MICEKTGCCAFLEDYNLWVHADSYMSDGGNKIGEGDGTLVLRVVGESPLGPLSGNVVHYHVKEVSQWFDRYDGRISTLITEDYKYLGYAGVLVIRNNAGRAGPPRVSE